jgi:hypothetical protein
MRSGEPHGGEVQLPTDSSFASPCLTDHLTSRKAGSTDFDASPPGHLTGAQDCSTIHVDCSVRDHACLQAPTDEGFPSNLELSCASAALDRLCGQSCCPTKAGAKTFCTIYQCYVPVPPVGKGGRGCRGSTQNAELCTQRQLHTKPGNVMAVGAHVKTRPSFTPLRRLHRFFCSLPAGQKRLYANPGRRCNITPSTPPGA